MGYCWLCCWGISYDAKVQVRYPGQVPVRDTTFFQKNQGTGTLINTKSFLYKMYEKITKLLGSQQNYTIKNFKNKK